MSDVPLPQAAVFRHGSLHGRRPVTRRSSIGLGGRAAEQGTHGRALPGIHVPERTPGFPGDSAGGRESGASTNPGGTGPAEMPLPTCRLVRRQRVVGGCISRGKLSTSVYPSVPPAIVRCSYTQREKPPQAELGASFRKAETRSRTLFAAGAAIPRRNRGG